MSKAIAIPDKFIDNALPLAIGAAVIIGVLYYIVRKTVGDVAKGAAGLVTGDNVITKNQTNFDGEKVDSYEGKGVLGTLGAAANTVSGGLFASIGQSAPVASVVDSIAGWFTSNVQPTGNLYYRVIFPDGSAHAVVDSSVDKNGYFTWNGTRYRMGYDSSNQRVAVKA